MDVVGRMIRKERNRKYKLLRRLRKARDIASKHLKETYTTNYLRNHIYNFEEFHWYEKHTVNELAKIIYRWCKGKEES